MTLDANLLHPKPTIKTNIDIEILKTIIRKQAYNDILDHKEKQIFLQVLKNKKLNFNI